jgi:hypothetical protein
MTEETPLLRDAGLLDGYTAFSTFKNPGHGCACGKSQILVNNLEW